MSASDHSDIIERFNKLSDEFDSSLNEEDKMIDNLFAALEVFADNNDTDRIVAFLDEKKNMSVFDVSGWLRKQKFRKATFVRKFQEILDILFKNIKVDAKDGESSTQAAKSNQITNEDGTRYGRKLDVLILSEQIIMVI